MYRDRYEGLSYYFLLGASLEAWSGDSCQLLLRQYLPWRKEFSDLELTSMELELRKRAYGGCQMASTWRKPMSGVLS